MSDQRAEVIEPGSPESLARHMQRLYGKRGATCTCELAYKSLGRLHGVNMGKGWVRMTTTPGCPDSNPDSRETGRERCEH